MSKKILVVGDLHCGSNVGLMKEGFEINAENDELNYTVKLNKVQEALYGHWTDMLDEVGKVDYVFCMGDLVEGKSYKDQSTGLVTPDMGLQEEIATDLLRQIRCRRFAGISGSRYHTNSNPNSDKNILQNLAREYHEKFEFDTDMVQDINGIRFHLRHKTSFARRPCLRESALGRDAQEYFTEGKTLGKIDVGIRAHTHYFQALDYRPYLLMAICPAYKWSDFYIRAQSVSTPDIGYLEFNVSNGDYEFLPHVGKL